MDNLFMVLILISPILIWYFIKKKPDKKKRNYSIITLIVSFIAFGITSPDTNDTESKVANKTSESTTQQVHESKTIESSSSSKEQLQSTEPSHETKKEKKFDIGKTYSELAQKEYDGIQTITVNDNQPEFAEADLSLDNGAWEEYSELDNLNRATNAQAMLNQSLMPTKKRESIASVTPTGWKNKKIKSGYLYNRSHLIGHALAGEDANWKNLITGTQQLNNPEMLRHEMDVKYYIDKSPDNYVRYSVTPVYRGSELLARGVHIQAQSINSDAIRFNVFIFNIQDGVNLNYSDGSSQISSSEQVAESQEQQPAENTNTQQQAPAVQTGQSIYITPTGSKYHTHPHGNGNFSPATLEEAQAQGLEPCKVCY